MINPAKKSAAAGANLPPRLQQAVAAHESGDLAGAFPLYRRFVDENPGHPTALQLLGLLHSQRHEYDQAIALMRESLRQFPQQPEVANNLGNALAAAGRPKEAVDSYGQAIRLYPRYAVAFRNLGLCYLQLGIAHDARVCFQRAVDIDGDDAVAWMGLGNAQRHLGDLDQAIACFEKAVALKADYAEAYHNLGVCLRLRQQPRDAIGNYESARRLGLDRSELYQNLGSAYVDAGDINNAIDAYRKAIDRDPGDALSHRDLNKLLWEQEMLDDHLSSYAAALAVQPASALLRRDYAMALNQKGDHQQAERVLMQGLRQESGTAELRSILAYTLEQQNRWSDALQLHLAAVRSPDAVPNHRISYARALLACHRPDEALQHAEQAARETPFDQRAIAYLALCWRMLGDERDAILNNYEQFVRVFDVPVPVRFKDTGEFNAQLARVLEPLHRGRRHPPEQTLRGGTQTHGDLLNRSEPEIMELARGIADRVRDYIARLPFHDTHPLLSRRSMNFHVVASWSVRLAPGGFHTMHVHPLGWISSAYYVQVPPEVSAGDACGGGIKFGEPDIDIGPAGAARRLIQPATGQLVLFPSYMWHGTVPFTTGTARTTVAFDAVPAEYAPRP